MYKKSLFIFRRDLRLDDNTGLIEALKRSALVIPAFIFTPQQIEKNPYKSQKCLRFMIESLHDLDQTLRALGTKLYCFEGNSEEVIDRLLLQLKIEALFINCDYTAFSQTRDEKWARVCKKRGVAFHSFHDALLHSPGEVVKPDGKPYAMFTPFYKAASKLDVSSPVKNRHRNYFKGSIAKSCPILALPETNNAFAGGREECLKILKKISRFSHYTEQRDFPAIDGTTHLSAHLKFTTCSPREVYAKIAEQLRPKEPLLRQLYWRDFFTLVAFYFPRVFGSNFQDKFDSIRWKKDSAAFRRWCSGTTGFPIVDAGMREMNASGYMHNRVRMITASFLVKDLHIDWRLGEKYFAQHLIDYDPAVNNGNWQWVAGTGCDAAPYFRVFNPWMQQKKFDPDCVYIQRWIPELSSKSPNEIHQWGGDNAYPEPMCEHKVEAANALKYYRAI